MNRRDLLRFLGGTVAATAAGVLAPQLEVLVPKRTFFLPPAGGWPGPDLAHSTYDVRLWHGELTSYAGIVFRHQQVQHELNGLCTTMLASLRDAMRAVHIEPDADGNYTLYLHPRDAVSLK